MLVLVIMNGCINIIGMCSIGGDDIGIYLEIITREHIHYNQHGKVSLIDLY